MTKKDEKMNQAISLLLLMSLVAMLGSSALVTSGKPLALTIAPLKPYYYYDSWVIFTNTGYKGDLMFDVDKYAEIIFPEYVSTENYVYKVIIWTCYTKRSLWMDVYDWKSDKTLTKEIKDIDTNTIHKFKLTWCAEMIQFTYLGDGNVSLSIDDNNSLTKINHVGFKTTRQLAIVYNNTYTYFASKDLICPDDAYNTDAYLNCNLDVLDEKVLNITPGDVNKSLLDQTNGDETIDYNKQMNVNELFRINYYTTRDHEHNYKIKLDLAVDEWDPYAHDVNNTRVKRNSYLTMLKNGYRVLRTPAHHFLDKNLTIATNFDQEFVFINNAQDNTNPSIFWKDDDPVQAFRMFDRFVVQNLIHKDSKNNCQLYCLPRGKKSGIFNTIGKLGRFIFKSKLNLEQYCRDTEFERYGHTCKL